MFFDVEGNINELENTLRKIEEKLKKYHVKPKEIKKAQLASEEIIVSLINKGEAEKIRVYIRNFLGDVSIEIRAKAKEFDFDKEVISLSVPNDVSSINDESEQLIRAMIIKSFRDKIKCTYKNGYHNIRITIGNPSRKSMIITFGALFLGVILGLIFKLCLSSDVTSFTSTYILLPIKTIILNLLMTIVGPLVFFSVVSCFAQFTDLKLLGKIGGKVIGMFFFTSFIAVIVGYGVFYIINPGTFGQFIGIDPGQSSTITNPTPVVTGNNILDNIINLFPSSFIAPFVTGNTIQIIIISVLIGAAIIMLGDRAAKIGSFFEAGNELFMKVTAIITKIMPLFIFVSMMSLFLNLDFQGIGSILLLFLDVLIGLVTIIIVYMILIFLLTRRNPFIFLKKTIPCWLNAFAICSSTGSMPKNLEVCDKDLKIDSKVYSFAIPLGATINMDGMTILYAIVTLYLAKGFGVTLSIPMMIIAGVAIIIVSMSAPGVPGATFLLMAIILNICGIPLAGISVVMGLTSLVDPFVTANNIYGDLVASYIVAHQSKLIKK